MEEIMIEEDEEMEEYDEEFLLAEYKEFIENVYLTVTGMILPAFRIPEAKNLYAPGEKCIELYGQVQDACQRICQRLDVKENGGPSHSPKEEDRDLTQILNLMDDICQYVGYEMFRCGALFAQHGDRNLFTSVYLPD